jgi:hypothetical protein
MLNGNIGIKLVMCMDHNFTEGNNDNSKLVMQERLVNAREFSGL